MKEILCDVKIWIFAGIVLALLVGFDNPNASEILMVVLIAQMAVSLHGIRFVASDLRRYGRGMAVSVVACFGINTLFTLAVGLLFAGDTGLWTGWVMLASVPCAVSAVVAALTMKGDVKLTVLSLTAIYVIAIALAPSITGLILGSSVNPFEILKYMVMFIIVPFGISLILGKFEFPKDAKTVFINIMLLTMVFIGLGSRRDFILNDPNSVAWIALACVLRTFVVGFVILFAAKRFGIRREDGIVYTVMAVWKNSGMSVSLTMVLFGATMPNAVLPCIVSLVVESVWFAAMSKFAEKCWPVAE